MTADESEPPDDARGAANADRAIDVRAARGVQIGDDGTQYNVQGNLYLSSPGGPRGPIFTVPPLNGREVRRSGLVDQLADMLTTVDTGTVTMSTTLRGAGGFGKTTLACMVAADPRVVAHFPDGILWIPLSEDVAGDDLADRIDEVIALLTGQKPAITNPELAGAELGQVLGVRRILLVIDDVWHESQLRPFSYGGPGTVRLVTTRQRSIAGTGQSLDVDAMDAAEAHQLLTRGLTGVPAGLADDLLAATGRWPVLLGLVNGMARQDAEAGRAAEPSLVAIRDALRANGPAVLDPANSIRREEAVATTLGVSLARLTPDQRDRYLELAVFGEDVQIPGEVVQRLWQHTAGWNAFASHRFCQQLMDLSLLAQYRLDAPGPRLLLHDVVRRYLRGLAGDRLRELDAAIVEAHRALVPVAAGDDTTSAWSRLPPEETYLWTWLVSHLWGAGLLDELRACLHSCDYLVSKLDITGPAALAADLSLLDDDITSELHRIVVDEAHVLAPIEPAGSLTATLASRLLGRPQLEEIASVVASTLHGPALSPAGVLPDVRIGREQRMPGHTDPVRTLAIPPSADWLASAGDDGQICVWDPQTGDLLRRLIGDTSGIGDLAVSPDGLLLASAGNDGAIRIWDPLTGGLRQTLAGHHSRVLRVYFSPDGSWLASSGGDGTVRIWDIRTGSCRHLMGVHRGGATVLAMAPDGAWVASAGPDRVIQVWDPLTGEQLQSLIGHTGEVLTMTSGADGRWLASGSADGRVLIWDLPSGRVRLELSHVGWVHRIAASADGSLLATGDDDAVRLWDTDTGVQVGAHTLWGRVQAVTFSPTSDELAYVGSDAAVRLWVEAHNAGPRGREGHSGRVHALRYEPGGRWLASAGDDGTIRIWDVASRSLRPPWPPRKEPTVLLGRTTRVHTVAVSPDGGWVAAGGDSGVIEVQDAETGDVIEHLAGHAGMVLKLIAGPGGSLVSGGDDGLLRIWNPAEGPGETVVGDHGQWISAMIESSDGARLYTGDSGGTVHAWAPATQERLWVSGIHYGNVNALVAPGHGRWLASAGSGGAISIHNPTDGSILHMLPGHEQTVMSMVAPATGDWLASCSWDGSVRIWNPDTGEALRMIHAHTSCSHGLAVSPDGTLLASAGDDATAALWDPLTGSELHRFTAHTSPVRALAFHGSGELLASASWDGTVRIWDVQSGAAVTSLRVNGWLGTVAFRGDTVIAAGRHGPYLLRLIR